ncbi:MULTISPECIES: tail fiber protein [Rodentibacter]|uniref:tail fiber protein n=1 Tax=Rodentibacter TaxID=1960084 RepID=UPI0010947BBB|nr:MULTISPECIES: tail fiber protein [Pasteurellaceae]MCR1837489.1 tail fiber protein [Pasteurella caecimuris]MCU0107649.1 tail fiber protein [Pasteurella caecimuris]NBH76285.1 hypothetical protein [Rodentibacter pneumotropicus]TGY50734.1 hypothetical protein E5343_03585 [Pasteurella caecimuris]THA07195.1 hypothetical protein D3M73_03290 [Rodentibacter pneumotropicus]
MANLKEQEKWEDGIYQIEENDPVLGGENGITNKPAKQLANRTLWLKKALELLTGKSKPKDLTADSASNADKDGHSHALPKSSTSQQGIVQLDDTWESDSREKAPTARVIKAMKQLFDSLTRNLSNYIPNSKKSNAVNSPSSETVATSAAAKTAFDKGVEALNKANQVDAATLKKNGNQSINGVLKAENVGNAWAAYKFGAKQGEWQIEVHPDSHTTGNRRFNMLWSPNGGNRVYLSFPHIGDGGETVAYQSFVNAELTKVRSLANQNSQNFNNYIHNNKKSNAADSNSTDTVATSRAVKLAFDRGTTALNTANSANTNATNANNNANTRASKRALTGDDLNNITASGIYGQNANINATPARHYPIQQAGMLIVTEYSGYGAQQLYAPFNAGYLYARGRNASNGWDDWKRIDGLDKVSKSGDTMTGNLTLNHAQPRFHGNRNNSNNWYVGLPDASSNNVYLHSYAHNTSLVLESNRIRATKPLYVGSDSVALIKDFTYQKIGDIEVRKYPDGTMFQTCRKRMLTGDYSKVNFNWAIAFTEMPILTATAQYLNSVGDHDTIITFVQGTSNTACHLVCGETYNNSGEIAYVNIVAIGRWK